MTVRLAAIAVLLTGATWLPGPARVRAQAPAPAAGAFAARVAALSEPSGYFDTDNLISNERSYLHVVPTLRERVQDIRDLAAYFLGEFCARNNFRPKTLDEEVLPLLERYDWPGNIRELRNAIERMAILSPGDAIDPDAVPLAEESVSA